MPPVAGGVAGPEYGADPVDRKFPMIVRRRTWLYRLAGQLHAQTVSFRDPVTASRARVFLRQSVGNPLELWARSANDLMRHEQSSSDSSRAQTSRR
ncbi:uncharacterized protein E1O_28780 [Burkholderiales bacterium GJ-E10]|nr:uncharacterized protein E1O_28780 [Burkholderiales bacterium GJ-E10]